MEKALTETITTTTTTTTIKKNWKHTSKIRGRPFNYLRGGVGPEPFIWVRNKPSIPGDASIVCLEISQSKPM